jgi:hypothetical protein
MTGGRRKIHNEELHNLYSSPNIVSDQIKYKNDKSSKMRWAGNAVCMREKQERIQSFDRKTREILMKYSRRCRMD